MWKLRFGGLILMIVGGFLFVYSIRDVSSEWPQIGLGLLSVFVISIGFGLLIMPSHDSPPSPSGKNDSPESS